MKHTKRSSIKFLLLVMICGIVEGQVSLCNAQNSNHINTRQGWDKWFPIYGDVVSVTRKEYTLNDIFGQHVKGDTPLSKIVYKFNTSGDVVELSRYSSHGALDTRCLYKYSPNNKLVEESIYNGSDGSLSTKKLYTYNEHDVLTEIKEYYRWGTIISQEKYTYNTERIQKELTMFEDNGDKDIVSLTTLDKRGNVLSTEFEFDFERGGVCYRERNDYKYDTNGCVSEIICYDDEKNIAVRRQVREYNSNKCVTTLSVYDDKNKLSERYEYQYDEFNNVIEVRQYQTEILLPQNIVEYYYDYRDDVEIDLQMPDSYEEPALIKAEVMPKFMGGDLNTFRMWFAQEFRVPEIAAKKKIQGKVVVQFVVEKDGGMSNIEFLQSPHSSYEEEIRRILVKAPKWTPGYQRGVPVRVRYILPIDCRLQ